MKVLKFGGTSVGSAQRMFSVAKLIDDKEPKIIVLSAMAGTTNSLVEIINALYKKEISLSNSLVDKLEAQYLEVLNQLYKKEKTIGRVREILSSHFDIFRRIIFSPFTVKEEKIILAQGELISTALFHSYLEEKEISSFLLSALNFMRIDVNEEPELKAIEQGLKMELAKYPEGKIFITQGYICRNSFGEVDNLKRGGSDYSASLIGAAIQAEEIQIWTDIDGMHNNDPRIVDNTKPIAELSFDEAAELAYFGAKILHPSSVLPAKQGNIPVRLLNTMEPTAKGTLITAKISGEDIKAVAAKDNIAAIKIKSGRMLLAYGFLGSVFEVFERYKTSIDMITTSEVAVSITIDNVRNLSFIVKELEKFGTVEVDHHQTIICVVGNFSVDKQGYAFKVLSALKNIPIRMISYGGSENNVSILVNTSMKNQALLALHEGLFT